MSDRAALTLVVYSVDEQDQAAVLAAIDDAGLESDTDTPEEGTVALGTHYVIGQTPLGEWQDLSRVLRSTASSAVFELWQDPFESTDGDYVAHVPGIGTYNGWCSGDGTPHVDIGELVKSLNSVPSFMTVEFWLAQHGDALLGRRILAAIEAHKSRNDPVAG